MSLCIRPFTSSIFSVRLAEKQTRMELIERKLDGIARQLVFYIPAAHAHKQHRAGNQQKLRRAEDDRRRFVRQEVYIRQGDGRDDRTEQDIIDSADTGYGYARRGNRRKHAVSHHLIFAARGQEHPSVQLSARDDNEHNQALSRDRCLRNICGRAFSVPERTAHHRIDERSRLKADAENGYHTYEHSGGLRERV